MKLLHDRILSVVYTLEEHRNLLLLILGQALLIGGLAMVWLPLALLVPGVELTSLALFRELPTAKRRRPREVVR